MKAYNETWIRNKQIMEQAHRWHRQGLLTTDQFKETQKTFPVPFQNANGFVKIGLFIFTLIAISGCYFLVSSFLSSIATTDLSFSIFNILFGAGTALITRQLITARLFYRSGVDNALIVAAIATTSVGLLRLLPSGWPLWFYAVVILLVLLPSIWYYADLLLTLAAFVAFVIAVFDFTLDLPGGRHSLPFVLMFLAFVGYLTARSLSNRKSLFRGFPFEKFPFGESLFYWEDCLVLIMWLSLGLLLISPNYFLVREVNHLLLASGRAEAPEINLPWLFWTLTIGLPSTLLLLGIQQKNRPLLLTGALGWLIALVTWHYYYPLFSIELFLVINGVAFILIALALIRYLRIPNHGFTDTPDKDAPKKFLLSTEILTAIQGASPHTIPNEMQFGGGNFGGGGSGDQY